MSKTLLIQLSGPASSGKTSLARELASVLGAYFVGEPIQDSVQDRLNADPVKFQREVLAKHYLNLKTAVSQNKIVVTDRAIQDLGEYAKLNISDDDELVTYLFQLHQCTHSVLSGVDHITYGLHSLGFEENGVRYSVDYEREKKLFYDAKYVTRWIVETDLFNERLNDILGDLQ